MKAAHKSAMSISAAARRDLRSPSCDTATSHAAQRLLRKVDAEALDITDPPWHVWPHLLAISGRKGAEFLSYQKNREGKNTMQRIVITAALALAALASGTLSFPTDATAQIAKDIVGTWTLVSNTNVRSDGTKVDTFGANPKGFLVFASNGRYSLTVMRADLPKFAGKSFDQATPEEAKAVIHGMIAHFGTYSINEADKTMTTRIEGSSFPNLGGNEQKRIILSLTADELKYSNPTAVGAASTVEVTWKRVN
jgi:hypothetical protein